MDTSKKLEIDLNPGSKPEVDADTRVKADTNVDTSKKLEIDLNPGSKPEADVDTKIKPDSDAEGKTDFSENFEIKSKKIVDEIFDAKAQINQQKNNDLLVLDDIRRKKIDDVMSKYGDSKLQLQKKLALRKEEIRSLFSLDRKLAIGLEHDIDKIYDDAFSKLKKRLDDSLRSIDKEYEVNKAKIEAEAEKSFDKIKSSLDEKYSHTLISFKALDDKLSGKSSSDASYVSDVALKNRSDVLDANIESEVDTSVELKSKVDVVESKPKFETKSKLTIGESKSNVKLEDGSEMKFGIDEKVKLGDREDFEFRRIYNIGDSPEDVAENLLKASDEDIMYFLSNSKLKEFLNYTSDELDAIQAYTGNAYAAINNYLRGLSDGNQYVEGLIEKLDSVVAKGTGFLPGDVAYRVMSLSDFSNTNLSSYISSTNLDNPQQALRTLKSMVGKTLDNSGYMSSSTGGYMVDGNIHIEITTESKISCADLNYISSSFGEREILFGRDTSLKFTDVSLEFDSNGSPVYTIKAIAENNSPMMQYNSYSDNSPSIKDVIVQRLTNDKDMQYEELKKSYYQYISEFPKISFDEYMTEDINCNPALRNLFFETFEENRKNGFLPVNMTFRDYLEQTHSFLYEKFSKFFRTKDLISLLKNY